MAKTKPVKKAKEEKGSNSEPKLPYSTTPGALRRFLELVPKKPKPEKVNQATLQSWGLRNTNDQSIIRVLKALGLVGANNEPTDDYVGFMHAQTGSGVLGNKVRQVYAKLFEHSLTPHKESDDQLRSLFNIHSGGSDGTISFQIQTFKALCDYATFDGVTPNGSSPKPGLIGTGVSSGSAAGGGGGSQSSVTVHIDLHIHLPENKSRRDYECIFEDIARYIYRQPINPDDKPVQS